MKQQHPSAQQPKKQKERSGSSGEKNTNVTLEVVFVPHMTPTLRRYFQEHLPREG